MGKCEKCHAKESQQRVYGRREAKPAFIGKYVQEKKKAEK
jgi:hypothetical protein